VHSVECVFERAILWDDGGGFFLGRFLAALGVSAGADAFGDEEGGAFLGTPAGPPALG
jgi:hypothetical protein